MCGLKDLIMEALAERSKNEKFDANVEAVVKGEEIFDNPHYHPMVRKTLLHLEQELFLATSHEDRIRAIKEVYPEEEVLNVFKSLSLPKSEYFAKQFQRIGHRMFRKSKTEMAIHCMNLSLMFVPEESNIIGSIYGDRGFFLKTMQDFDRAISDLEMAEMLLQDHEPEVQANFVIMLERAMKDQKHKLLVADCLHINSSTSELGRERAYCNEVLFKVYGDFNVILQSGASCLKIVQHPIKGRIITTIKELSPGTVVIAEEPYVTVMSEGIKWDLKRCYKCYKEIRTIIQCNSCVFAAYCSDECCLADFEAGHKFECQCMEYFHATKIPFSMHLAFKSIAKAGPDFMYQLFLDSDNPRGRPDLLDGFNPRTGIYASYSYYQIYNLRSHFRGPPLDIQTWISYTLTKLLEVKTDFFTQLNIGMEEKKNFFNFIASTFLHHAVSIPYNVVAAWEEPKEKVKSEKPFSRKKSSSSTMILPGVKKESQTLSLNGIFSLISLLSHSCDPSALRTSLKNGKTAIITCRRVRPGEEITISYGYDYTLHELKDRQEALSNHYCFKCDCIACTCCWITRKCMSNHYRFICPSCSDTFSYDDNCKSENTVLRCKHPKVGSCRNCGQIHELILLEREVEKHRKMIESAKVLLNKNQNIEAIPVLLLCIDFFQRRLKSPSKFLIDSQSLLLFAYDAITENKSP